MKKTSFIAAAALSVALSACTPVVSGPLSLPLQERLRNPLVAERYWSDLVEHMADFERSKDPMTKDPVKEAIIEDARTRSLARLDEARTIKNSGIGGGFTTPDAAEDVKGDVLLTNDALYIGTTFITFPSVAMHVFVTTAVDPRDVSFPDKTAVDLGELQTAFGAQTYPVPKPKWNPKFRTAVLYDTQLNRLIAFAQLSK